MQTQTPRHLMTVPEGGCGGADFTQGTRRLRVAEEPEHRQSGPGGKPGSFSPTFLPGARPACLPVLPEAASSQGAYRALASFWLVQCYGRAIYTPRRAPPEPASLPSHCRSEAAWVRDIWPALGHTAMGLTFSFTLLLWAWGPFPGSRPQGRSVSNPENTAGCPPTPPYFLGGF